MAGSISSTFSTASITSPISQTTLEQNKLKEYELATKGLEIKFKENGESFTEQNGAIATHTKTIKISAALYLFIHEPNNKTSSPALTVLYCTQGFNFVTRPLSDIT